MYTYEIGMDVFCSDGKIGKLIKVALDPHSNRVTDLIVEKGLVLKRDRVFPVELVERVSSDAIYLTISQQAVTQYPVYREVEFKINEQPILQELGYLPNQTTHWDWRYGATPTIDGTVRPAIREKVHKGIEPTHHVIGRGTRVCNVDETIGYVDHLLLDQSNKVTHLVMRRGLLPFRAILPIDLIREKGSDTVYVSLTRQELNSLEKYTPRSDKDLLVEIGDKLSQITDFDLNHIKVELVDGLVKLTGSVASVMGKERAQRIAESVKGVLGVQNEIRTNTEVESRVTTALLTDPRTLLARIDVTCDAGVVTLRGSVKDKAIIEAATEIAANQPGVRQVENKMTLMKTAVST